MRAAHATDERPDLTGAIAALPARLMVAVLAGYKRFVSPLLPPTCRFEPTCSEYASEAFRRRGFWRGGWMTLRRLARCHPLHPGGSDPVR